MIASPRNKWIILIITSLGEFLGAFMATSVNVALPSLKLSLNTDFNIVQWVVLAFLLATGTLLPIVGRLADMFGKKRLYLFGFMIFTLGSLLCGLAPSISILIFARAIQGVGSAFLTALGLAIITDTFPDHERGRAIGISASLLSTGIVVGPTVGGLLIDVLSWRWIFLLAVPLGFIATFLAQHYIPAYKRAEKQSFDVLGATLLFLSLLSLLLGLTFGQEAGFQTPVILGLFVASIILTAAFIITELRVKTPVLELRLFRSMQLTIGLISGFFVFVCISGTIFLMPFYLENILGYSPRNVGMLMSIVPIFLVVLAPIAGNLADKFGERPVTLVGVTLLLIGYTTINTLTTDLSAFGYVIRFMPIGMGMAVFQTPNNSAIMGSVDRARSGVAGGLLALTRTLGQTAGIAVLGTLWVTRVLAHSEGATDATSAPAAVQVQGLHDMFFGIQIMIGFSLLLVLWDLIERRRQNMKKLEVKPIK